MSSNIDDNNNSDLVDSLDLAHVQNTIMSRSHRAYSSRNDSSTPPPSQQHRTLSPLDVSTSNSSLEHNTSSPNTTGVLQQRPYWVPDKDRQKCPCDSKFTVILRRHHCRGCGEIFCSDCVRQRCSLPQFGYKKLQMVCMKCYNKYHGKYVPVPGTPTYEQYKSLLKSGMPQHQVVLKEGVVLKRSHTIFIGKWKQRYAQLAKDALCIFKSKTGRISIIVPLMQVLKVYVVPSKTKKRSRYDFNVEFFGGIIHLGCPSEEECRSWVLSISNTVFHYKSNNNNVEDSHSARTRKDTHVSMMLSMSSRYDGHPKLQRVDEQILSSDLLSNGGKKKKHNDAYSLLDGMREIIEDAIGISLNDESSSPTVTTSTLKLASVSNATFSYTAQQSNALLDDHQQQQQQQQTSGATKGHKRFATQFSIDVAPLKPQESEPMPSAFHSTKYTENMTVTELFWSILSERKYVLHFLLEHWCYELATHTVDDKSGAVGFRYEVRQIRLAINKWHSENYKHMLRSILAILHDIDEGTRDLALRVLFIVLQRRNHNGANFSHENMNLIPPKSNDEFESSTSASEQQYVVENEGISQIQCKKCQKSGRQLQYYVEAYCCGKHYTTAIKDSLLTLLLTNISALHKYEAPRSRVALFGATIHNVHLWRSIYAVLGSAESIIRRDTLRDISTICVRRPWNLLSVVRQRRWVSWIVPQLKPDPQQLAEFETDPTKTPAKKHIDHLPIEGQSYRYAMNALVTFTWATMERCNSSQLFVDVITDVICSLQSVWKNNIVSLFLVQRFLSAVVHKIQASISQISHESSTPFWKNALCFCGVMRTYLFCTPTFGKADDDDDDATRTRGLTRSVRFGDVATFGPHIVSRTNTFVDSALIKQFLDVLQLLLNLVDSDITKDEELYAQITDQVSFFSDAMSFHAMLQVSCQKSLNATELSNVCEEFVMASNVERTPIFHRLNDKVLASTPSPMLLSSSTSPFSMSDTQFARRVEAQSRGEYGISKDWSGFNMKFGTNVFSIGENSDQSDDDDEDDLWNTTNVVVSHYEYSASMDTTTTSDGVDISTSSNSCNKLTATTLPTVIGSPNIDDEATSHENKT